jgi:hypothetical protein
MSTAALRYSGPLAEAKSSTKVVAPKATAPKAIAPKAAASGKSLLARFFDALIEARMRQATRELAMHRHLIPENSAEETGSAFTSDGRLVR